MKIWIKLYNYILRSAKDYFLTKRTDVCYNLTSGPKGAYRGMKKELLEKIENIEDERLIRALFYMIAGYEKKAEK